MSDLHINEEVFFDHIGQIVMSSVLQGVIVGSRNYDSSVVNNSVDEIATRATSEIVKHMKIKLHLIREEIARSHSVKVF